MRMRFCSLLLLLFSGCSLVTGPNVEKDAISQPLIKVEKDAISQPLIKVEKDAISQPLFKFNPNVPLIRIDPNVNQPLVKVDKDAINAQIHPNAINIPEKAVSIVIEKGAITIEKGAININLHKPPVLKTIELKGVRVITIEQVLTLVKDRKLAEDIINNLTIYRSYVEAVLKQINEYNENYAQ